MLKVIRIIFGTIAASLAIYSLITQNFLLTPYMLFFLGGMFLVMYFQERGKSNSIMYLLVAGFNIFVSIFTSLFN
ncbi:hypothetical protein [Gottfriedia solisilvae]|uniref:DUF3953 domain-containing protein n=1 Tax=Gottfriedia solisilvae TaxID=1516104 RepID=A0A8J3EVZ7_9BACI|nr:hypothetical protein [Gottfriedia solisilvae]GGI13535.1 hypothetical protein GCM10007380_18400 [Gottfriedia solisilvae]